MGVEIAAIHGKLVLEDGFSSPSDKLLSLIPKLTSAIDTLTSKIDSIGKRSSSSVPKASDDAAKLQSAYDKLSAKIDPVVAGQQKLADATKVLDAAHKAGLISHQKYTDQLEQAKKKFSDIVPFAEKVGEAVGSKLSDKFKLLGEFASKFGGEAGEALEHVSSKAGGVISAFTELASHLGPLLPLAVALAAALLGIGIAFKSFEYIKEAVAEGLQLQGVIERLNDSLKNTGSYSGLSSHEIIELAGSYALLTGRTKEEEIQAALTLTRFKNLTEDVYPKALDAVNAYARSLGITAAEAAKKLGPLLDGNTRSLRAAKEAGVDLTTGQQAMLKSMVDSGDIAGYQAKLFDILREKVGLAAGAHETLGIQAGRIRYVFSELKEGIASELIPALEYLTHDIFGSIDDWKQASKSASDFGHIIGDFLRGQIYGVIVIIHDVQAAVDQVFIWMDQAVAKVAQTLAELFSSLHLDSAANVMLSVVSRANFAIANTTAEMYKNKKASDDAIDSWLKHKQALEGDTDAHKKHGSAQDEVESKQKKLNDLIGEGTKAIQAYTDKFSDLADKLIETNKAEIALYQAAQGGLETYARELLVQERRKAVLTEITQLEKEHRTEIERLQNLLDKAVEDKRPADAVKFISIIKEENDRFDRQKKAVEGLTGSNFDLKKSTDSVLDSTKLNLDYTARQTTLQAELTDELTGTTIASRENSIQLDITRRVLDSLKHTQEDLTDSITETVRREHDFTNSMKDALEVAKSLSSLNNQASLSTAIGKIDTGQSRYLQEIETKYLEFVAGIGKGSIEEGQRIIDEVGAALEALGIHIGSISDKIREDLLKLQDAEITKKISGASKTPYDLYKEERDRIEQYVSGSTERTSQQVKDAGAYIDNLDKTFWSGQIDNWASSLSTIGQIFGGFVGQLLQQVAQLANNAQQIYKSVSSLASSAAQFSGQDAAGAAAFGGAAGGIAAEAYIWYQVYHIVAGIIAKQRSMRMGTSTQLEMVGGNWSSPSYIDESGRKMNEALRNLVQSVLDSIHGVLTDMPQITIRARADGKKFGAYVAGIFVGEFDSAQEAMQAAVAAAVSSSSFAGLADEMKKALQASIGKTLSELEDNIKTANEAIADRLGDVGNAFVENIDKYLQRIEAERKLGLSVEDTTQAMIRSIQAYANQILGIDTTASDRLAALRSLDAGMKEASGSIEAELQKRINDVMAQIAALENQARHPNTGPGSGGQVGGGGGLGSGFNEQGGGPQPASPEDEALRHLREVLRQYTDELDKIPKALTDQQINMGIFDTLYQYLQKSPKYAQEAAKWAKVKVDIEFAQIKLQLELLGKWEEFQAMFNDAYQAALSAAGKTPHAGGGGGKGSNVQSFIDDRTYQLSISGLDAYHQKLAQIQKDYDEQLKAAGKNQKQREQLLALEAQEIALAKQQNQADVMTRFNELVGKNDAFTQLHDKFGSMAKEIKDAGYPAKKTAEMLKELTKAEVEATHTLAQQDLGNLFTNLANYIDDQSVKQEALKQAAQIKFTLDMLAYKADFELLKAKHLLTQKEIDQVQGYFDWIDKHPPDLSGGTGGGEGTDNTNKFYPNSPDYLAALEQDRQNYLNSIGKGTESINKATDLLKSYQTDSRDELTKQLDKIRDDFATISSALGNTAEVIAAKNNAISRAIDSFLEPIKSFRSQMDFNSGTSTLTGAQQFSSIQNQFRELVSHATLADRDKLLDLAGQYRDIARQSTAGQGYRFIDQEIKNALDSFTFLVGDQAAAQLGTSNNPMSMAAPKLQQAVELGNSMIVGQLRDQNDNANTTNSWLKSISQQLDNGLTTRNVA